MPDTMTVIRKKSHLEIAGAIPDLEKLQTLPRHPVTIVCEDIRSLNNVGSIFRTADGIRAEKLILCGYTGCPPRKEIDKVALGAVDSVPWEYRARAEDAVADLRARDVQVVAVEHTDSSEPYHTFPWRFPVAIVLGNECDGISPEVVASCDASVEIPMYGIKQSLNVSTAVGVVGYEVLRACRERSP